MTLRDSRSEEQRLREERALEDARAAFAASEERRRREGRGSISGALVAQGITVDPRDVAPFVEALGRQVAPGAPVFLTPTEALEFDITIPADWLVRVPQAEGEQLRFVVPDVGELTLEEVNQLIEQQEATGAEFAETQQLLEAAFPTDPDVDALLGQAIDEPEEFLLSIREQGDNDETRALLAQLFPDATATEIHDLFYLPADLESNVREVFGLPRNMEAGAVQDFFNDVIQDPNAFYSQIRTSGQDVEGEALVRQLFPNFTDEDVDTFFVYRPHLEWTEEQARTANQSRLQGIVEKYLGLVDMEFPLATKEENQEFFRRLREADLLEAMSAENKESRDKLQLDLIPEYGWAIEAGVGDLADAAGGLANWMGQDGIAVTLNRNADELRRFAPVNVGFEGWQSFFNPRFYSTTVSRALPFTLALVPAAIGGAAAGAGVAAAAGLGALWTTILAALGATALSRPIEAALEAGGAFDAALDQGFSKEEASGAAAQVFEQNLALAGTDVVQFAAAFAPAPLKTLNRLIGRGWATTIRVGGKVVITGLTEAGEEAVQDIIQRSALGQEIVMDDEMKTAMAIGGIMGVGLGVGGDVMSQMMNDAVDTMPPALLPAYQEAFDKAKAATEGISDQAAAFEALNVIVGTPEGKAHIEQQVEKTKLEEFKKEVVAETPSEQAAWDKHFDDQIAAMAPVTEAVGEVPEGKHLVRLEDGTPLYADEGLSELAVRDLVQSGAIVPSPAKEGVETLVEIEREEYRRIEEVEGRIFGLKQTLREDPVANIRIQISGRSVPLTHFISLREQSFPDTFTIKQAKQLNPDLTTEIFLRPGTRRAGRVPRDVALDRIVEDVKEQTGNQDLTADDIADRVEQIRLDQRELRELQAQAFDIYTEATEPEPESEAPPPPPATPPPPVPPPMEIPEPLPPHEDGDVQHVLSRIQFEAPGKTFKEMVDVAYHQFHVKAVDDLHHLDRLVKEVQKGGAELSIEENPYLLARLLRGVYSKATSFLETGTFGKQVWGVDAKGRPTTNFTGESFDAIMKDVRSQADWREFSAYVTAQRTVELAGRDIETGIDTDKAASAIATLEAKHPGFRGLSERLFAFQDRLLVYMRETRLISEDLLTKLRENGKYVPFHRVLQDIETRGYLGKKLANIADPIKRIKGSELSVINPLENVVKNVYTFIYAADRNQIGVQLANLVDQHPEVAEVFERVKTPTALVAKVTAKELGIEIAGLSEADTEQVFDIFRPSMFLKNDEVTVLIDGKKNYFRVDPDLRESLLNLDRESMGMLGKFLGLPARWLRAGAILNPEFAVRNPAKDQFSAFILSNYGFIPGVDFLRGVAGVLGRDADWQLFNTSGAAHSEMISVDREVLSKSFKQIVSEHNFTQYVKNPIELLRAISAIGENATRLGEFKRGLDRGANPLEAAFSAREVTLDFAKGGTAAHAMNRIVAFFNANVLGWTRMIDAFKQHPTRTSLKVFGGITLPSILLYYINRDDPRWKEIPQWQKDLFWIVLLPDAIIRIPKPFELGVLFGSVPERFLEWLDTRDPDIMNESIRSAIEVGTPGLIPTAALPVIETLTNYSFFRGRAIVPASRKDLPPELQYTRYTTEFSKKVGELLGFSPAHIDNILNGYFAGLGRYAIGAVDAVLKGTGVVTVPEPSAALSDFPVVGAFVVRDPIGSASQSLTRFYNTLEKFNKGEAFLKEMLNLGDMDRYETFKAAHPELLFTSDFDSGEGFSPTARYLRAISREMSEIRKASDEVLASKTMTPEEKRAKLDELAEVQTELAQRTLALFEDDMPPVLGEQLSFAENRLGEILQESGPLSLDEPDIYGMTKLGADYANTLQGISSEDLAKLGEAAGPVPPTVESWYEMKTARVVRNDLSPKSPSEVNADPTEGDTFEELNRQFLDKTVEYPNQELGNFSRETLRLLREFHDLPPAEQPAFLEAHPELAVNPRQAWLEANSHENAVLALWGQAQVETRAAYDELRTLIKQLNIPETALPDLTLPPAAIADDWFAYGETGEEFGYNSAEVDLMLAQNEPLRDFLRRDLPDSPVAALELKVKHRKLFDIRDDYADPESAIYIESDEARSQANKLLREENPEWVADQRRIAAYDNEGTRRTADSWVRRGTIVDEFGGGSSEAKTWLLDNPEIHQWALEHELLTDDGQDWNEDVLRLNAELAPMDEQYDDILGDNDDGTQAERRQDFLEANPAYADNRRRRNAHSLGFPDSLIETYVEYYNLPEKGFARDRFRLENAPLDVALTDDSLMGDDAFVAIDPATIPDPEHDRLLAHWGGQITAYEDEIPEQHRLIKDNAERARLIEQDRQRLFEANPAFESNYRRFQAYGKFIEPEFIEDYVNYYDLPESGFARDRYLKENLPFYEDMKSKLEWTSEIDFSKVWTERFETAFNTIYQGLPKGAPRLQFRGNNLWFDKEGVALGKWQPYDSRGYEPTSQVQRIIDETEERLRQLEEDAKKWR